MNPDLATPQGTLYLVATPIGNLSDMTFRAVETLKQVDLILAEDTRHAKILLNAFQIQTPMQSFHAHNEAQQAPLMIARIQTGLTLALISDAGTPLIQDPGFPLVTLAIAANIPIIPIPGPSAVITALCAAGLPTDRFLFAGFLPPKAKAKTAILQQLKSDAYTLVFYESTHRIRDTIETIQDVFGKDYAFVLAKELTKAFERFIRGPAPTILAYFEQDPALLKGEFVILLPPIPQASTKTEDEVLLKILLDALPLKQAVQVAEKLSTTPKNQLYKMALIQQKAP